ncbi:MAG: hypothetical protein WD711_00465 [Dongiaceae bacterium]
MAPDAAIVATLFEVARTHFVSGNVGQSEPAIVALLAEDPDHFYGLQMLAQLREVQGRHDDAAALWQQANRIRPGHARSWTRRAVILLRRNWGMPPSPRRRQSDRPGLSVSRLGISGRFGNQLLQYGIARLIAERHGLAFEAPDWIGRDLFRFDDPLLTHPTRPPIENGEEAAMQALVAPPTIEAPPDARLNGDLSGFFQSPTGQWAARRDNFRKLFAFQGKAASAIDLAWNRLADKGDPVVAIHLRRGDFGRKGFWIAPTEWYIAWLNQIWPQLPHAVLYVASDDAAVIADFKRFDPVVSEDIADALPGAEFLIDFAMLMRSPVLGISNSSFSFVAAMLNPNLTTSFRPMRQRRSLIPFDPWNAPVLLP